MEEKVVEEETITYAYMGERLNGTTLVALVCPLVNGELLTDNYSLFKKPRSKGRLSTGWIHSGTGSIDPTTNEIVSISFSDALPIRPHILGGFDREMSTLERSAQTQAAMLKKAKERTINTHIDELVKPIRKAMDKTNHAGRAAILALVIERLTK
ncbi:hypothetical protein AB6E94_19135 [Vibrio lentus]|uniref:hypothetical protein n=1 Tax=Vibrio splendidus TaxID=29497 RepID=UPI000C832F40|nr:hypothetical protein [Vibrio splendidus]PMG17817.1 hypothetical protein BCU98_00360 [Vibrio splendidus]